MGTSIDWPLNPNSGDTYAYGDVTYTYDGYIWAVINECPVTFETLDNVGDVGTGSDQLSVGNDSRFSDNRTPSNSSVIPIKLGDEFKTIIALGGGVNIDWSAGQVFTKTLSTGVTFTFSNLYIGVKFIETTGDYANIFPAGFTYVGGDVASTGTTVYQIVCTNTSTPVGYYLILKDES